MPEGSPPVSVSRNGQLAPDAVPTLDRFERLVPLLTAVPFRVMLYGITELVGNGDTAPVRTIRPLLAVATFTLMELVLLSVKLRF